MLVFAYLVDTLAFWDLAKELVHAFETTTLCLWHEEPCEDKHGEAESSIDKVCPEASFANGSDHVGGSTSDNEVESENTS